eukprot:2443124-Rhodomonas_salina.1
MLGVGQGKPDLVQPPPYWHSIWCYAMCGTSIAYAAATPRTSIAYAATKRLCDWPTVWTY